MGVWGEGVFQNDVGSDCKSLAIKLLGDGLSGSEVEARMRALLPDYFDRSADLELAKQAVLALSLTLHDHGFLEPSLQMQAMAAIESERMLKISKSRQKHLQKALEKLQSDQPAQKRPKRHVPYIAPFLPGEFLGVPVSASHEGLVYVTGRGFPSVSGDRSNTVRILGPLTDSFSPNTPPPVPYLSGQEVEIPQRYFTLLLKSRPPDVRTIGRYFPPPDDRPEELKRFLAEQAHRGIIRLPADEDGVLTHGASVDWKRFLDAIRTVIS